MENFGFRANQEAEDTKIEEAFCKFVIENNCTASELEKAYLQFCGAERESDESNKVSLLRVEMERLDKEFRFPLNRFVKIIESLGVLEGSVGEFEEYLTSLSLSGSEKGVLMSIVKEGRSGEIECLVAGKPVVKIIVENNASQVVTAYWLKLRLVELMKAVEDRGLDVSKMEIWFEEK